MTRNQEIRTCSPAFQSLQFSPRLLLAACCLLFTSFSVVWAHDPGLSAAELHLTDRELIASLTFAGTDIEQLCRIDSDNDGNLSAAEFDAAMPALEELARNALEVSIDGNTANATYAQVEFDDSNAFHFHLIFSTIPGSRLTVRSVILARLALGHKQYFSLKDERSKVLAEQMLDATRDQLNVSLEHGMSAPGVLAPVQRFLLLGIEHIFTGYDHLAFLLALLLAGAAFREVAKIITAFTAAHSLTLALATFNVVQISPAMVEPLIAVSIVYVGIENLVRHQLSWRWLLAFSFGLIHGLGFASVLHELGIGAQAGRALVPLLSFNLGVELGQISIAAVVLPLIWRMRRNPAFVLRYTPAFSLVVALLGGYWLIERTILK